MKSICCAFLFAIHTFTSFSQVVIPMQKKGNVYLIPCQVNGLSLKFILDTGASDVSISSTEAMFMLKNGYLDKHDILGSATYGLANGELVEGAICMLRTIYIGGIRLENVKASVVDNASAPLLLGQSALNRLGVISIDYKANTLIIHSERDTPAKPEPVVVKPSTPGVVKVNFQLSGWSMANRINVDDDSDETGSIVFKITVDEGGDITRIQQLQSTVSPSVADVYRRAVQRIRLRPTGGQVTSAGTGTISFIIKTKE